MKKIIFRRPFVTKKDRQMANVYMIAANELLDMANELCAKGNTDSACLAIELTVESMKYTNKAAKYLGFRNFGDMMQYNKCHGKF